MKDLTPDEAKYPDAWFVEQARAIQRRMKRKPTIREALIALMYSGDKLATCGPSDEQRWVDQVLEDYEIANMALQEDESESDKWQRELVLAGWIKHRTTLWEAPNGGMHTDPYYAWTLMKKEHNEKDSLQAELDAAAERCYRNPAH